MNPFILALIPNMVKAGFNALKDHQAKKTAIVERKDELRKMKLETDLQLIKLGNAADIEQDTKSRGFAGWMDDISFVVFLLPVPLAFIPPAVPHIKAGFTVLGEMPVEYQVCIGLMLASVWGYKRALLPLLLGRLKK